MANTPITNKPQTPMASTAPTQKKTMSKPADVLRRTSAQVRMANMSPTLRRASDPKFMGYSSYKQKIMEEEGIV